MYSHGHRPRNALTYRELQACAEQSGGRKLASERENFPKCKCTTSVR
jgi:hypothetical protein